MSVQLNELLQSRHIYLTTVQVKKNKINSSHSPIPLSFPKVASILTYNTID